MSWQGRHCCQEGHKTWGLFWGKRGGEPRHARLPSVRGNESKMAPCCFAEGQVGRRIPDTVWHVSVKSLIMSAFDSIHLESVGWLDRLAKMQMSLSCTSFGCFGFIAAIGFGGKVSLALSVLWLNVWPTTLSVNIILWHLMRVNEQELEAWWK